MRQRHLDRVAPLMAAAFGAVFFTWIMSPRVLIPTEVSWTMQADWRIHSLGWQFFRHEPWHWPPGRVDRYFEPLGTSIGLTDSIPIAAFALKPFSRWLPASIQYLGPWLCLCFALQGAFAALLMRLWTSSGLLQLLGAGCFVLLPTLLIRTLHPALCAHWLLLWALWLYFRVERTLRAPMIQATALALVAGLVHPYLAVMVLALLAALGVRLLVARRASGVAILAAAVCATLAGWWLSGLLTVTGAESLATGGLTKYSMNLLAPVTPTGWTAILFVVPGTLWSTMLPAIPLGAEGQAWEGFQYFGTGVLLLMIAAIIVRRVGKASGIGIVLWPLITVVTLLAIYALSPRVTFGSTVLFDITTPWLERLAIFRATGRFFWPAAYVMLTMALAIILSRLTPRVATVLLCVVIITQLADLREAHASRRRAARDAELYSWRPSVKSPAWDRLLPHYEHVVAYPPTYCGASPMDIETLAYLAGTHGLSLNSGLVARYDEARRLRACEELVDTLMRGDVDDSRIYIGRPEEISRLKGIAKQPVVCGVIDAIGVCATARSYEAWRDVVRLE